MRTRKHHVACHLDTPEYEALKTQARTLGISISALVRKRIRQEAVIHPVIDKSPPLNSSMRTQLRSRVAELERIVQSL